MGAVLVGTISLGLLVGFRWVTTSPFFALRSIEVVGCTRLTPEEVVNLFGAELGDNVLELKLPDIEERVFAHPWTKVVMVRRILPGQLRITIEERHPAYWIRTVEGLAYVDAQGEVIDKVDADRLVPLPLLDIAEGAEEDVNILPEYLQAVVQTGVPVTAQAACFIHVGTRSVKMIFDDPSLTLVVEREGWKRNMHRLGLVWNDLVRRGEAPNVDVIRVVGGKVFVRA